MTTPLKFSRLLILAVGMLIGFSACQEEVDGVPVTVTLTNTSLGPVLTGANGRTLYFFAPDVSGVSSCTGGCTNTWPVFYRENLVLGAGLTAREFGTITRADGAKQTTFNGWPLYSFRNDANPGDVRGENVGNVWFVAKTDYTVMLGNGQLRGNDGRNYTATLTEGTGMTTYFTDREGRTLYRFSNDRRNKNNFTRADFGNNTVWPIVGATSLGSIPSALNRADFGTIDVFGRTQLTYKGNPLYYFGTDAGVRGSTKGVSVPRPGVWPFVNASTPEAAAQ